MSSIICTLFEGDYHYGLSAFVNSVHKNGFKGVIYAGYKGSLSNWCSKAKENDNLSWNGASVLDVTDGVKIIFLPVDTHFHLTNYKPFFMLKVLEIYGADIDNIVYFDPDIVLKCEWSFFETWMSHGVALVHEIVSNDMPPTHPIRMEWIKVIKKSGRAVTRQMHSYINGGFCGVAKRNIEFLETWCGITNTGIEYFKLKADQWNHTHTRTYIFYAQDQDALNISAMCSQSPISEVGPEGMDFIHGGFTMSHALGSPKPWKKNFFMSSLKGIPPSLADKAFWLNVGNPLKIYSSFFVKRKKIGILTASFIGRFYSRS